MPRCGGRTARRPADDPSHRRPVPPTIRHTGGPSHRRSGPVTDRPVSPVGADTRAAGAPDRAGRRPVGLSGRLGRAAGPAARHAPAAGARGTDRKPGPHRSGCPTRPVGSPAARPPDRPGAGNGVAGPTEETPTGTHGRRGHRLARTSGYSGQGNGRPARSPPSAAFREGRRRAAVRSRSRPRVHGRSADLPPLSAPPPCRLRALGGLCALGRSTRPSASARPAGPPHGPGTPQPTRTAYLPAQRPRPHGTPAQHPPARRADPAGLPGGAARRGCCPVLPPVTPRVPRAAPPQGTSPTPTAPTASRLTPLRTPPHRRSPVHDAQGLLRGGPETARGPARRRFVPDTDAPAAARSRRCWSRGCGRPVRWCCPRRRRRARVSAGSCRRGTEQPAAERTRQGR